MTPLHPSFAAKLAASLATVVVSSLACAGGQKAALKPSRSVSAADGKVEAKQADNGNTHLELQVEHLAPPQSVSAGASTYVVWALPAAAGGEHVENLGALSIGDERKGELKAFTPLQSFDVLVTPEVSAKVQSPSHEPVLTARIWMPSQ